MEDTLKIKAALRAARDECDGKQLNPAQQRDLDWLKERWFLEFANQLPKKLYKDLSGEADSQLDRIDRIYNIPCKGLHLDLARILQQFHAFVKEHGQKIKEVKETRSAKHEAEQRMLDIKIQKIELDLAERANKLIDRELVRRQLQWLANQFSEMAAEIGRTHGAKPQESINEFLKKMERELESSELT